MKAAGSTRPAFARALLEYLEQWASDRDWKGTDQYEGLNATRMVKPLMRSSSGRRAVIQAVKRSPVEPAAAAGDPPQHNAAALAWFASAYARNARLPEEEARLKLRACFGSWRACDARPTPSRAGATTSTSSRGCSSIPGTEPNTIATAYAGMALLDAHAATGDEALLEMARGVGRFFLEHVPQTEDPPGAFFGYLVEDRSPIHNSNLHVCALLARLHGAAGDERMLRRRPNAVSLVARASARRRLVAVRRACEPGLDRQLPHGVRPRRAGRVRRTPASPGQRPRWSGASGSTARPSSSRMARPSTTRTPSIRSTCSAWRRQSRRLSLASKREPSCLEQAWDVLDWACRRMRWANGMFAFQRRRYWTNRASHMRGVVAPMVLALTHQVAAAEELTSSSSATATATGQSPEAAEA